MEDTTTFFGYEDLENKEESKYKKLGLNFNPFPRSGTANTNNETYNRQLIPIDEKVKEEVKNFIKNSLTSNALDSKDKFMSATIRGNYGSGKTQLLLFVKTILDEIAISKRTSKKPYVIYINNPGVKLLELIGSIISYIGEENFKRFIWNKIILYINKNNEYRNTLDEFIYKGNNLFQDVDPNPFSKRNTVSYKAFLNSFYAYNTSLSNRKKFENKIKKILNQVLTAEVGDAILAQYFYDLLSEDLGINKTWEALATGNIKQLENKEADIIKYIVKIIKEQGFTDFFILVDEFEDITQGRLSKSQVDNYLYNLRTLLDEHREWCLLFAMTGQALTKLKSISPPLGDRITNRLIILQDLNTQQATKTIVNFLNLARAEVSDKILPFEHSGVEELNNLVEGNLRKLLKSCFYIIEKATEEDNLTIDSNFINKNINEALL